jgi:hypothetical protein
MVHVPENAPWVADWIEEHAVFPNGAYDDQVDTTSMAHKGGSMITDMDASQALGAIRTVPDPPGEAGRGVGACGAA